MPDEEVIVCEAQSADLVDGTSRSPPQIGLRNFLDVWQQMYKKDSKKDWLTSVITAGLGAGIVTSFAISQGQHPLLGLSITGFAIVAALVIDHYTSA